MNCVRRPAVILVLFSLAAINTWLASAEDATRYRYVMLGQSTYTHDAPQFSDLDGYSKGTLELHSRHAESAVAILDMQIWGELGTKVFNPHRNTWTHESYNVAFFDEQKNHVGNLYPAINVGSYRPPDSGDWIKLHSGGGICTRLRITSRKVYRPWNGDNVVLPAGKYEVQIIANSMMFAFPPLDLKGKFDEERAAKWPKGQVVEDAWRSNKVSIVITEDDPVEPPK